MQLEQVVKKHDVIKKKSISHRNFALTVDTSVPQEPFDTF